MIRWMLRGHVQKGEAEWVEDIDVDSLVRYIRQGQTYDGGFSESSVHESHGLLPSPIFVSIFLASFLPGHVIHSLSTYYLSFLDH